MIPPPLRRISGARFPNSMWRQYCDVIPQVATGTNSPTPTHLAARNSQALAGRSGNLDAGASRHLDDNIQQFFEA